MHSLQCNGGNTTCCSRSRSRRYEKEQLEIHSLVTELESVRQSSTVASAMEYEPLEPDASLISTVVASSDADVSSMNTVVGFHTHAVPPSAPVPATVSTSGEPLHTAEDLVHVPREKLHAMLQLAQETLNTQKKLLQDIHAIERHLGIHPHSHDHSHSHVHSPLGH